MTHPRLRHYPHHWDYVQLTNEFRPFVMFTHEKSYRSKSVNTDAFGLREHYDAAGRFIDLRTAGDTYPNCKVLLGGSTAFGVDATSDKLTLAAHLNQPERPCLNLGIRGAVSHQELQALLLLRRYLPPITDVVLLTGVNLPSLASLDDAVFFPEFGGIFSEPWHYDVFCDQYKRLQADHRQLARRKALSRLDRWFQNSRWGAMAMRWLAAREPVQAPPEPAPRLPFDDKLADLERQFQSDLAVWTALQAAWKFRVHFVLQPVLPWTNKSPTHIERECVDADLRDVPSIGKFANRGFCEAYAARIAAACATNGLAFHDANRWFDVAARPEEELFTDICHLTDRGYRLLGNLLQEHLDWAEVPHDRPMYHLV